MPSQYLLIILFAFVPFFHLHIHDDMKIKRIPQMMQTLGKWYVRGIKYNPTLPTYTSNSYSYNPSDILIYPCNLAIYKISSHISES